MNLAANIHELNEWNFRTRFATLIHGFIGISEWERDILNHPALQRLRRIRQLGLSDMVYPGSVHTRFEHSLGAMHVASRMFSEICKRSLDRLSELKYEPAGLERLHALIRVAALTHDVGHAPFSHAAEELMDGEDGMVTHERYTAGIVKHLLRDVIENHQVNRINYQISADEVTALLTGELADSREIEHQFVWRELISGQLDADRADYLLRDAYHAGVEYGKYDLERMLVSLQLAIDPETDSPRIAISEGGWHVAESFIIARYMMFTQVYFQHTRRVYDKHCVMATREVLLKDTKRAGRARLLPHANDADSLNEYLEWDDWRVLGHVKEGEGGEHGTALLERTHFRRVFETPEVPSDKDLEFFETLTGELGDMVGFVDEAQSSWYWQEADALIDGRDGVKRLSQLSTIVGNMKTVNRHRVYVRPSDRERAEQVVRLAKGGTDR